MARRAEVASEIGLVKGKDGLPIRDNSREKEVQDRFVEVAHSLGVSASTSKELSGILVEDAVKAQSQRTRKSLAGKTALVVGGAGKMGEWTCRFLSNRGAKVKIWDSRGQLEGYQNVEGPGRIASSVDFVVVASPLGACPDDLQAVVDCSPKGVVFDVASVKSQIIGQLKKAAGEGILVTSVHPMFGPGASSPRGMNVVICDCGSPKANEVVSGLFSAEGAHVSTIDLDKHDEMMSYVLGLSHLCSLLFAGTTMKSGRSIHELRDVQGPSFSKMTKMARDLSNESKRVYHDIQCLNPHTRHMIATMETVLRDLKKASLDDDPGRFRMMMESNRKYLEVG